MLGFIQYLFEAASIDDELLGHLTHTKDIPHESPEHVRTAIDLIQQFHHLRQGKPSSVSASLKHDGGASVHILHDKDGRVGVTDKHRLTRGVVAYSDEDVDKHFGKHPGYAAALKHLRNHGHEIVSQGHHVQGDILWTHGDSTSTRKGEKVDYTPNRITYHAKSSAPLGIAIHTEVKNGIAQAPSKRAMKKSSSVFVPKTDFNPAEHEYSNKDRTAVEYHIAKASELAQEHTTEHLTPDHIEHLTIYHNRVARGHRNPTVEGYASYLRSRGETDSKKLKSESGQKKVRDKFESMAQHAEQNSEHFNRSIQIRHHLQAATDSVLNGINHPDLGTSVDGKKSKGEGVVLQKKDNKGQLRPVAKLVHSDIQHALGNNPRFPNKGAINESKNSSAVLVVAKMRYPTQLGHGKMIDHAKDIAEQNNAQLHIHLTGTSDPLTPEQKKTHAEAMFKHPVESTKNVFDSLSRLTGKYHTLHIVGGSDRNEYGKLPDKYTDKNGKEIYNFPGGIHFHEVSGKRSSIADIGKHPTEMSKDELERSSSATEIIGLAKKGDYPGFKAYHPGISDKTVRSNYETIRSQSSEDKPKTKKKTVKQIRESLKERIDPMIEFRKNVDAKRLVPTRSGSKGGNGGSGGDSGNGN